MDFIKPKVNNGKKVEWIVSEDTRFVIKKYAQYTGYTESEVADIFLKNILKDEDFQRWLSKNRHKKKIEELGLTDNIDTGE